MPKNFFIALFLLASASVFAQQNDEISLVQFVENTKAKNESIKNADSVNVMINDMFIENQEEYTINPKNVAQMEILVIDPKKNTAGVKPSIIISTKNR